MSIVKLFSNTLQFRSSHYYIAIYVANTADTFLECTPDLPALPVSKKACPRQSICVKKLLLKRVLTKNKKQRKVILCFDMCVIPTVV